MTAADKFGIAFSIGITVALIAFAMSFSATGKDVSTPVMPAPIVTIEKPVIVETPVVEVPVEQPEVVTEEEIVTEEEMPAEEESVMEEDTSVSAPMSADVSIPDGTSTPGCEADNACYVESEITVASGATVTWTNDDSAAHTVTSGTPTEGPDGAFDSSIIMAGKTFEHTFEEVGQYDYFCIVHPWMTGNVTVE